MNIRSLPKEKYPEIVREYERQYSVSNNRISDPEEIMSTLVDAMGGLLGSVSANSEKDLFFFRVRLRSTFGRAEELFGRSQHSYPPASICNAYGRCNIPGHPVFYGSDSHESAIHEMKSDSETDYVLSFWRLPARPLVVAKFLCGSGISNQRLLEHKSKILSDAFEQSRMHDELNCGRLQAFLEAWSDLFLSEEYALSSAIAYRMFYGRLKGRQDLIVYASAFGSGYMNFAIPVDLADQLELVRVYNVELMPDGRTAWSSCWDPGTPTDWRKVEEKDLPYLDERVRYGILNA